MSSYIDLLESVTDSLWVFQTGHQSLVFELIVNGLIPIKKSEKCSQMNESEKRYF